MISTDQTLTRSCYKLTKKYMDSLKLYKDVFQINISDEFDIDLSVTFVTFQISSRLILLVQ